MSLLSQLNPLNIVSGAINTLIDRLVPDKALAERMKIEALAVTGERDFQLLLAQLEVNKLEAASTGWYKGGWRPGFGWTSVLGFFYEFVLRPFLEWGALIHKLPVPPHIDTTALMTLAVPMLGIGAYRTIEKLREKD